MNRPLRVLVTTDAFPPVCGGSGWSTWELVRGLTARGHAVEVIKVVAGARSGLTTERVEGQAVTVMTMAAPRVPFVRNVAKNERTWQRLARHLSTRLAKGDVDVVHAQHVMTTVASIRAARAAGVPVVATVRDYWPVCYWSDLIVDPDQPGLCPHCTVGMMTRCVRPHAGAAYPASWPLIPYMRANLSAKRRALADAGAIVAVSSAIARDLRARAPEIAATPMFTIPNPVDMRALDEAWRTADAPMAGPYVLYAGKLAVNKGVQYLPGAIAGAGLRWPIVVVGDGPFRSALETEARARGLDLRVLGWRDRDEVWAWMRHATMLAFPSYGPESLSRVLIEAAALGVPVAAMETGGTADIIEHERTGLLSTSPEGLARDLARLASDDRLRAALGAAARAGVRERFSAESVVDRIEQVYRGLVVPAAA